MDSLQRRTGLYPEIELPFLAVAIAKRVHLRKLLAGVDVQRGKRHVAEEGFARQPDHDVGVFSERPQQRQLFQTRECLAKNIDALRLERVQVVHAGRKREQRVWGWLGGRLIGRECVDRGAVRRLRPKGSSPGGFGGEKMHLWALASRVGTSIVAAQ